jgi:hypothetical protein
LTCANANSFKAAGVMRLARLEDVLYRAKANVLRGGTNVVKYISSIANESKYNNKENYLLMVFAKLKIAKRTKIWGMKIYDDEKTNIKR